MKLLTVLCLATGLWAHAEVKVTIGEVNDRRTTGKFFSGLEVQLKLTGPELTECKAMRVTIKDAADDTGKALPQENMMGRKQSEFEPPQKGMGNFGAKETKDEFEVTLKFENPTRAAKTIKAINGTVELLLPSGDPASVITASVTKEAGKPLVNDALKAAGVELTLTAPKGSEHGYLLKDPQGKVAAVEFCTADGKALETQGRSSSRFNNGPATVSISLKDAPADTVAKIYLLTPKSTRAVPIALSSVPLP